MAAWIVVKSQPEAHTEWVAGPATAGIAVAVGFTGRLGATAGLVMADASVGLVTAWLAAFCPDREGRQSGQYSSLPALVKFL